MTEPLPPDSRYSRTRILLALCATVALGLASRLHPLGWYPYDKSLGDALYAVAAYLALALILVRTGPKVTGGLAVVLCLGIEAFKLTGIPATYGHFGVVRWLLGTTFSWHNIACYVFGVLTIVGIDAWLLRPCQQARERS